VFSYRVQKIWWEDNIKVDVREIVWGIMDWIHLAQDRDLLAGSCENNNEPSGSITRGIPE
jgi:hypothetical protein